MNEPIDPIENFNAIGDKLLGELRHEAKAPAAPVKGCVSVMPMIPVDHLAGAITLQFNGFAVLLNTDGTYAFEDTSKAEIHVPPSRVSP